MICVGNFTAGGTGKTPLALYIARELTRRGERPAFLTRGHGGWCVGPHRVDPANDTAADVGDEALLLSRGRRRMWRATAQPVRSRSRSPVRSARPPS